MFYVLFNSKFRMNTGIFSLASNNMISMLTEQQIEKHLY